MTHPEKQRVQEKVSSIMATIDEFDSLAHVTLAVALEKSFDIKFSLMEVRELSTPEEVVDHVLSKLDGGAG